MTNTKTLTGAVAFLAIIAVLDNFLLVELKPGFEGMVRIESDDAATAAEDNSWRVEQDWNQSNFWIDKQPISQADFEKFVAVTGYQLIAMAAQTELHITEHSQEMAIQLSEHPDGTGSQPAPGQLAWVDFESATAYCNWLGKKLPSQTQIEMAAKDAQAGEALKAGPATLHHESSGRSAWIGFERKEGLLADAGAAGYKPPSNLSSFHCIRNITSPASQS